MLNESEERKTRLANAVQKSQDVSAGELAYQKRMEREENLAGELAHMQEHLEPHGLTIAILLRSVAKQFYGVTLPVYKPNKDKE